MTYRIPQRFFISILALILSIRSTSGFLSPQPAPRATRTQTSHIDNRRHEWIGKSLAFYATVSREEKQRKKGQYVAKDHQELNTEITAKILYFARHKIKAGKLNQAERLYRKHIKDLEESQDHCDHTQLAVSVLLLTLLLQRKPDHVQDTRAAFVRFFRIVTSEHEENGEELKECMCSAKVLQAFALFEMKQGNSKKAFYLAKMAVQMDPELEPILRWKQFQEAQQ